MSRKVEIGLFVIVLLAACLFVQGWLKERDARIRAEAVQESNRRDIAADELAIRNREAVTAQTMSALLSQANGIHTSQQAAQVIVHYLPAPPAGPAIAIPTVERSQLPAAVQQELPAAPSYGILTQDQLVNQAKRDLACDATGIRLNACEADQADLKKEIVAETATANQWEAAAKGGTKFQRLVHVAKLIGCAAAGAGAGAFAGQKSPAIGAAIGGSAGVAVCSIF